MSVASASTTIKVHELPSGNVLHNYQPNTQVDGPIRSISWSKDGNWLALVPHSGLVEIISVKDQLKLMHTIHAIQEPSCASFQNNTKRNIAIGTRNGQVLVYDIKARNVKKRYPRVTSIVTNVEYTAKDDHIVAAYENGEAHLYSNVQNNLSGVFKIPRSQSISALRTNPIKRNYVVAGSNEGVVAVWDIHGNKNKFVIGSHKASVTGVAFSPIGSDLVVSTGLDRQFCLYDVGANKCVNSIFVENSMTSVDFSPDGKFFIMGSQKGNIYIYDPKNLQRPVYSFLGHDSSVDVLSVKKCEDYETSFSLSSEPSQESYPIVENNRNNDSFAVDMMICSDPAKSAASVNASNVEDSFIAAMGLNCNSIRENSRINTENSNIYSLHKDTPTNPSKILQERKLAEINAPMTSTPDFGSCDIGPAVSPIVNLATSKMPPTAESEYTENLEELIKSTFHGVNCLKEELKNLKGELKHDVDYARFLISRHLKQVYVDIFMKSVKEFMKIEKNFDNVTSLLSEGSLVQENAALKQENAALNQKIFMLEQENAMLKYQFNKTN